MSRVDKTLEKSLTERGQDGPLGKATLACAICVSSSPKKRKRSGFFIRVFLLRMPSNWSRERLSFKCYLLVLPVVPSSKFVESLYKGCVDPIDNE